MIAKKLIAVGVGVAAASLMTVAPASAKDLGGIDVVPTKGNGLTLMSIVTERGCAEPAKRVSAVIDGDGMPDGGQVIVAPTELLFSTTRPMELPVSNAFVIYAQRNSAAFEGKYTITVRCTDPVGVTVFDTFTTTMTWKTPGGSVANAEKATFTAKSTAGVVAAASGSTAPDAAPVPLPDGQPSTAAPSDAPSTTDDVPSSARPGEQPLANDERPDGSNPDAAAAAADEAAAEVYPPNTNNLARWLLGGFGIAALIAVAAIVLRGRSSPDPDNR